jgi:hypothetical protein
MDLTRAEQIGAERKLLAALCQCAVAADRRAAILRSLHGHVFADPDHQVVYRALAASIPLDPSDARQALTQAATRLGFPDLDFDALFTESLPAPNELDALLARL